MLTQVAVACQVATLPDVIGAPPIQIARSRMVQCMLLPPLVVRLGAWYLVTACLQDNIFTGTSLKRLG